MSSNEVYLPRGETTFYSENVNKLHLHCRNFVSGQTINTNVLFQDFSLQSPPRLIQLPELDPDDDGSSPSTETFINLDSTGWIISITCTTTSEAQLGQTYMQVNLTQGSTNTITKPLLSRYITQFKPATYPSNDAIQDPNTRPSAYVTETGITNPAQGNEFSYTVGSNKVLYPICLALEFTWGSQNGNPNFIIRNADNTSLIETDRLLISAEQDAKIYFMFGYHIPSQAFTAGSNKIITLPNIALVENFSIVSSSISGDDDYGDSIFFYEQVLLG